MTSIIKISALALLSLVLGDHAQATEPSVIMLSCDGKLTNIKVRNVKPQPINKMGLVVDFAERTISFLGSFGLPAQISGPLRRARADFARLMPAIADEVLQSGCVADDMSPVLAQIRRAAMSAMSPLSGAKQT
jgi:hypothetical protein